MGFSVCLTQKEIKRYFVADAPPHPTIWHDSLNLQSTWLHHPFPAQSPTGHQQHHTEDTVAPSTRHTHTVEVKAQTKTHGAPHPRSTDRKGNGEELPRSFHGLSKTLLCLLLLLLINTAQFIFLGMRAR